MRRSRLLHIITGLSMGGAEMALFRLLVELKKQPFDMAVVSLHGKGTLGPPIENLGIPVFDVSMNSISGVPGAMRKISKICSVHGFNPDLIQAWMYHANLATMVISRKLSPRTRTVLNIRTSVHNLSSFKFATRCAIRLGALLSGRADAIIYNSAVASRQHGDFGYATKRAVVIPNGFDIERFRPSEEHREGLRAELGIEETALVVGCLGRFHRQQKGNLTFVRAAAEILRERSDVAFLCAGRGMEWANPELSAYRQNPEFEACCFMLGERQDADRVLSAMDIFVSPAREEGFPNALAEAMLTGLSCVATDAGDSVEVLGNCGLVIEAGDAETLRNAVMTLLAIPANERMAMGEAARARIAKRFPIEKIARTYADLYRRLCESGSV